LDQARSKLLINHDQQVLDQEHYGSNEYESNLIQDQQVLDQAKLLRESILMKYT